MRPPKTHAQPPRYANALDQIIKWGPFAFPSSPYPTRHKNDHQLSFYPFALLRRL